MNATPALAPRLTRVVAFVAIVWAVAGTFIALDVVARRGLDVAIGHPELFGEVMLSPAVSRSTICSPAPAMEAHHRPPALQPSDLRTGAWTLGLAVGRDAILRQFSVTDPDARRALSAGIERAAGRLAVPAPEAFVPRNLATGNLEFIAFVESDTRNTARTLARQYSSQACELYKLGAVWGYSELVRLETPGHRAIFAVEIRHYARRAGLPDDLWRPMHEPTRAAATREELEASTAALTETVTRHLERP